MCDRQMSMAPLSVISYLTPSPSWLTEAVSRYSKFTPTSRALEKCFYNTLWRKWIRQELGEYWLCIWLAQVKYRHGRYWALGALTFWWWVWLVWPVPSHPCLGVGRGAYSQLDGLTYPSSTLSTQCGGGAEVRGWVSPGWSLPYRGKYGPLQSYTY